MQHKNLRRGKKTEQNLCVCMVCVFMPHASTGPVMLPAIHTKDERAAISSLGIKFFHPTIVRHSCLCDRLRQELIISRPVAMLQMAKIRLKDTAHTVLSNC